MSNYEKNYQQKIYEGLLPEKAIEGHRGYYPVCNAQEWEDLPLPYKVMEWMPVTDPNGRRQPDAVKAVIFDVTYMEPYGIRAKVSVHPQEVQKILFCLHKDTQCHLYSVCGVELESGRTVGAKWLQDSVSGAFGIYAAGQYVGQQGGFRGFIPERVARLEDGSFNYEWNKRVNNVTHYEISNPFGHYHRPEKDATEKLMDAMAEYAQEGAWSDSDLIDALIECGVTKDDFKKYGKWDFVKDYFDDGEKASLEEQMGAAKADVSVKTGAEVRSMAEER